MTTPTPLLLDTAVLSKIVDIILDETNTPRSKKSACLNRIAAHIAGPKHNWGFLTGHNGQITARDTIAPNAHSEDIPEGSTQTISSESDDWWKKEITAQIPLFLDELNSPQHVREAVKNVMNDALLLPTPRAWHKAGEIIKKMSVKETDIADFVASLRGRSDIDAAFIDWIEANASTVHTHITSGKSTFDGWTKAGRIIHYKKNCNTDDPNERISSKNFGLFLNVYIGTLAQTIMNETDIIKVK